MIDYVDTRTDARWIKAQGRSPAHLALIHKEQMGGRSLSREEIEACNYEPPYSKKEIKERREVAVMVHVIRTAGVHRRGGK